MARVTKKRTGGVSAPSRGGGSGTAAKQPVRRRSPERRGGVVLGYRFPEFAGPPPGSFDPGLEAQVRSSQRGLLDLIEQTRREGHRQGVDVRLKRRDLRRSLVQGRRDIARERGYDIADVGYREGQLRTSFARDIEDLGIAKQRGEEAYQRTLVDLQHRYGQAAIDQQSRSIQQGTAEAGTREASGAVRAANQTHDTSEVEREHREELEDLERDEGRVREDYGTDIGRLQEQLGRNLRGYGIQQHRLGQDFRLNRRALSLAAARATQDRATQLSHAKREQAIYQTDVAGQAFYQAHQTNPNIVFPVPAATRPYSPHAYSKAPRAPGVGRAISYPRRRRY